VEGLNVSRLSGRCLALKLLKRLSLRIPKNGEWRFSSSIPRRKWVVFSKSVQEHFRPGKRPGADGLPELLRSTPAGASKPNPANRHKNAGGKPREIDGVLKETGRADGGLVSKWIFYLTILNPRALNGSVANPSSQVNRCIRANLFQNALSLRGRPCKRNAS